jgi:shikimate dehydrogenase
MKPDLYAVFGNPVAHSKSPLIHAQFAKQTGESIEYIKIEAPLTGFKQSIDDFFNEQNGQGCNVTLPFKEEAFELADEKSERAQWAGAVNTLKKLPNGKLFGDNTDGCGLVRDLTQNHHVELKGKRILVLGAGGAVRGVLQPLLEQTPSALVIANRTPEKAAALSEHFKSLGNISASSFDDLKNQAAFNVIINGTSASVSGDVPPISANCLSAQTCAYDMFYSDKPTAFCAWASSMGMKNVFDGLGMLIEQAAEAFYVWRNKIPNTKADIISK